MSKYMRLTQEMRDEVVREFQAALDGAVIADGQINFSKTLTSNTEKATVIFTPKAFSKMVMLLYTFNEEVAWHGVAFRGEDTSKNEYYITDILVYPQEVTGATVNTDQDKYQTWLMAHDDDVFNNIRMQGHSHVNMPTNPSPVDLTHQSRILDQFDDDTFYIFMIFNKRMDRTIKIYDMRKNLLFDNADIEMDVLCDDDGYMSQFISGAKTMVTHKTYAPVNSTYPQYNDKGYGDQYARDRETYDTWGREPKKQITTPVSKTETAPAPKKEENPRPKSNIDETWSGKSRLSYYNQVS